MTQDDLESRGDRARAERLRSPPKAIRILLPVWGRRYVKLFLDYSLPTLLAPGNIPALAAALPCRFVVMTRRSDLAPFRDHPAWKRLESLCTVEVLSIDDLITASNHSTTITLAYQRAVVAAGDAQTDTCFFFLVSDYIVADGSLAAVLARMKAGASGVQAANMQAVDDALELLFSKCSTSVSAQNAKLPMSAVGEADGEGAEPEPDESGPRLWMDPKNPVAVFVPRDLVSFALERLHPSTIANMVDFPACHNAHTNRLFWRCDLHTIMGRFYLMHMICIRPETSDFVISSSCDYSFIPEMCPSGNVDVMTDSDDYLVMEFQPLGHERYFLSAGPLTPQILAASLNEWATAHHRDNSRHTIIYHAGDISPAVSDIAAEADAFVAQVSGCLSPTPVPHRDHPYWRGAIAAHRLYTGQRLTDEDMIVLRGMRADKSRGGFGAKLAQFRTWLVGRPLDYRPWQPRWLDFDDVVTRIRSMLDPSKRLIVVSRYALDVTDWCSQFENPALGCDFEFLLGPIDAHRRNNAGKFDVALVIMEEDDLERAEHLPRNLLLVTKPRARIMVVVINMRRRRLRRFNQAVSEIISRLFDLRLPVTAIRYVGASPFRIMVQRAMLSLARRALRHPKTQGIFALIVGPPLALVSLIMNRREQPPATATETPARCSSVLIELRVDYGDV